MRVLVCDVDSVNALALERALGSRFEIRTVGTLRDAELELRRLDWRPELVVAALELPDAPGLAGLEKLRERVGPIPLIISTGVPLETLCRQIDAFAHGPIGDRAETFTVLRTVLQQQQLVHQTIAAHKSQIMAEIDKIAGEAAEVAVSRGVDRLMARLGLDDVEGVRLAVRLARAWEAAKAKFVAALATGVASAFLLALGAGFVALVKGGNTK